AFPYLVCIFYRNLYSLFLRVYQVMPDEEHETTFQWLHSLAPCFAVNGDNVKVIESPKEFYSALLNGVKSANHRIVLSALYLGTDDLDRQLVDCLNEKIKQKGSKLDVNVLLDFTRGSRGEINSRTLLAPLIKENPQSSLEISFFHTPSLRGFIKSCLPNRWNEIVGINHLKLFVFDDTFIISGANLSKNYFEQRQDRYMSFSDSAEIVDYFQSIVKTVSSFSFQLLSDGDVQFSKQCPHHPVTGDLKQYVEHVRKCMQPFSLPYCYNENKSESNMSCWNPIYWFNNFFGKFSSSSVENQFNPANSVKSVNSSESSRTYFTSGYFNITENYSQLILNSRSKFDILVASPDANGFLGSAGFAGQIPSVYVELTKKFFNQIIEKDKTNDIKIWEYVRPQWTYHAKGLWFYDKKKELPSLTMIGSSNYGYRSVNRDFEAQITLVTSNSALMRQLHQERINLFKYAKPVTQSTFAKPKYAVKRWVSIATTIIKHYF
uniref:CDP-diacylglycerol--glycerol-3-phosphate 3-phosphatidyltransferase n=1 Tax=Ciona savignyi TaxID=51511 RepID=H2YAD9_CIOSA